MLDKYYRCGFICAAQLLRLPLCLKAWFAPTLSAQPKCCAYRYATIEYREAGPVRPHTGAGQPSRKTKALIGIIIA